MARARVQEYTRTLADGTTATVHSHSRDYHPAVEDTRRSPVEEHRRARLKEAARHRRKAALERGGQAARKGLVGTKRRARQSWRLAKRGGKRLQRAARYAGRKRRVMAACCVVGGAAEIGAGVLWSAGGVVVTTASILGATLLGGLIAGRERKS